MSDFDEIQSLLQERADCNASTMEVLKSRKMQAENTCIFVNV